MIGLESEGSTYKFPAHPDLDPRIGTEDAPLEGKEQRMVLFT